MTASEWLMMTVGDVARVKGGKRLPAGYFVQTEPTPYPYIRVTDMRDGGIDDSDIKYVPVAAAPPIRAYRIRSNDIFISVAGTLGVVGRVPDWLDGANLTENADRITDIKCDVDYLAQYLRSAPIQNEIDSIRTVGAQPKLALGRIKTFELLIPEDRSEQSRVAQALGDADRLIDSLRRLIAKKVAIKQGMMQELLTGTTRLPGFTGAWRSALFAEVANPVRERAVPQSVSGRVVELEHIEGGTGALIGDADVSESISMKTVFAPGDVLFGKLRAYLRKFWLADRSGYCSTEIWALRARPGIARGEFVRYIVESDSFIEAASTAYGTHMPRSDWSVVSKFEVALPPLDEQAAIAEVLANADAEITTLKRRLESAKAIKQGMMQELLTGRTRLVAEGVAA
jgi:Restriction endonuclease S subunits